MDPETPPAGTPKRSIPLYVRVLVGVALGALLGVVFGSKAYLFGLKNEHLGQIGVLVIKLLKALAVPLIFLSILDSFIKTRFTARQGARLLGICAINTCVAMTIGLLIMNTLRPGDRWKGQIDALLMGVGPTKPSAEGLLTESHKGSLSFLDNVGSYVPKSMLEPFAENNVIPVVLMALLAGAAFRRVKDRMTQSEQADILAFEHVVEGGYRIVVQMLHWVVELIPFAVFGVVAQVVGRSGVGVFKVLWVFLATMLVGLAVHALGYYPLVAWVVGGKSPRTYLGKGADAIITGLSCNSSLATVPITLACLDKMGVSKRSSRMAACVGTNLNNDGITLYEAMAALFLAQAVGYELGLSKQLSIVLQAIMAGAGVAGIPEAGLIVLPLVLSGAGLPEPVIVGVLPLIMTVDWIIARCRSAVNVMSDMLVAILLDVRRGPEDDEPTALDDAPGLEGTASEAPKP